jgi:predicted transcriptional regulator
VRPLGELEAAVMDLVWSGERAVLVREVVEALQPERPLAYTTVMTVMDNLHRKGWLIRERDGRAWRYAASGSRSGYTAELMNEALSTSDDRSTALAQFVAQMSPADAAALRKALDATAAKRRRVAR